MERREARQTAGRFAGRAIERAVALAVEGDVDGIVTAPLDKAALLAGGYRYPGHTEMLATLTGRRVAMMLAATKPVPVRQIRCASFSRRRTSRCATSSPRYAQTIVDAAAVTRADLREWFGIGSRASRSAR